MGAECVSGGAWLPSLREGHSAWGEMLPALQRLYSDGAPVDWAAVEGEGPHRRVALPGYPFQRKRHWIDVVGPGAAAVDPAVDFWPAAAQALEAQANRGPLDLDASSYPAKWDCLARLTHAHLLQTLRSLGAFASADEAHTLDSLLAVTGIMPAYRELVSRWLRHLVRHGALAQEGDAYRLREPKTATPQAGLWAEADERFHDNREMLAYVRHCASLLPAIVTGRESALESLFPGGSFELATALYEQSATMRYINALAAAGALAASRALPAGRTLRVLEIGAGTGGTTSYLLKELPADRTDYLFTDVSDAFIERARARFAACPAVRFGRFDLEIDPAQQGYAGTRVDLIVSANCVHAARDLRAVLDRLRTLLAPGGLLLLVESTVHFDFFDMTTGLIEGWQAFADDLRTDNPLLPPEAWTGALRDAGFAEAQAWPSRASVAATLGEHVILARAPGAVVPITSRPTPEVNPSARAGGRPAASEAAAAAVPAPDLHARLADAMPSERLGVMCGAVRGEVMRILRLDPDSPPARHDRLMELGMDSLMAVQLRNALTAMLEPGRPLPSTLSFDYPTINAIAQFLLDRGAAPAVPPQTARAEAPANAPASIPARTIAAMSDDEIAAALLAREGGA